MVNIQEIHSKAAAVCVMLGGDKIQSVSVIQSFTDLDPQGNHPADCSFSTYAVVFKIKGKMVSTGPFNDPDKLIAKLGEDVSREVILSEPKKVAINLEVVEFSNPFFSYSLNQAS